MEQLEKFDEYVKAFEDKYGKVDEALNKLFKKTYPKNTSFEDVVIKVLALDNYYSTNLKEEQIRIITNLIIQNQDIDKQLENGERCVVDYIGKTKPGVKNAYVFASKYCSFHKPDKYIVFDKYSWMAMHDLFDKGIIKSNIPKYGSKSMDFGAYKLYCGCMDELKKTYFLNECYKKIDEFLWTYGKDL